MVAVSNWTKQVLNRDIGPHAGPVLAGSMQAGLRSARIAIVTPSYDRDYESCRLLCETLDAHATGHRGHYIVVDPSDAKLFSSLAGPNRFIVTDTDLFPRGALRPLGLRWRGRKYWAVGLKPPINGWHFQQLLKIAIASTLDVDQVLIIDSDNTICRNVDLSGRSVMGVPLYADPGAVKPDRPNHVRWFQSAHALLGYASPGIPADDFVGNIITWDTTSVRAMIARIEAVNSRPWWDALCAVRHFSEYMIYGVAVRHDPELAARHTPTTHSVCRSYWEADELDREAIAAMRASLGPDQFAIAIQSFSNTSRALIREVIMAPGAGE